MGAPECGLRAANWAVLPSAVPMALRPALLSKSSDIESPVVPVWGSSLATGRASAARTAGFLISGWIGRGGISVCRFGCCGERKWWDMVMKEEGEHVVAVR